MAQQDPSPYADRASMPPACYPQSPHARALASNNHPVDITFKGLGFSVTSKDGRRLEILRDVSGYCRAGRLTALMGPSGAGKSSLMKILACNCSGGELTGHMYTNGATVHPAEFRRYSAVVWQRDILLATATVREALMTSAMLRLPQKMPMAVKAERVSQIIAELGIKHVESTQIGRDDLDGSISGISGGERRRVSVGIGLVTDPCVIFLDEPTTGLDSDSACTLMSLLKGLASRNRTVVCTIHQPSSDICQKFDDFMLLSYGRMMYCGEWCHAAHYFALLGYERVEYKSLAEHLLTMCKDRQAVNISADCYAMRRAEAKSRRGSIEISIDVGPSLSSTPAASELARTFSNMEAAKSPTAELAGKAVISHLAPQHRKGAPPRTEVPTSHLYQVSVLSGRFLKSWWRSPINMVVQLVQYIFFGLLLGATYYHLSNWETTGTFDRVASLWFCASCMVLQPAPNACAIFNAERDVLRRELSNGLYHFSSYFLAKSLTSVPFQLLFAAGFNCAVYFMVGYQMSLVKFVVFCGIMFLLILISETMGIFCAALHRDNVVGLILTSALCLLLVMFTGFIQTETPYYFVWIKKISYVSFGYAGLVRNEFEGLDMVGPFGGHMDGLRAVPANINNGMPVLTDIYILLGTLLGMRVITFFQIWVAIHMHWL